MGTSARASTRCSRVWIGRSTRSRRLSSSRGWSLWCSASSTLLSGGKSPRARCRSGRSLCSSSCGLASQCRWCSWGLTSDSKKRRLRIPYGPTRSRGKSPSSHGTCTRSSPSSSAGFFPLVRCSSSCSSFSLQCGCISFITSSVSSRSCLPSSSSRAPRSPSCSATSSCAVRTTIGGGERTSPAAPARCTSLPTAPSISSPNWTSANQ
mmetsp:Transcript_43026/g.69187  ORF Transcript_43026/g.69187 Transcript_43026/m.69187 type:complete len:208 (-) Transcript_43026:859-1482(-)